jgi:hypothetical protein
VIGAHFFILPISQFLSPKLKKRRALSFSCSLSSPKKKRGGKKREEKKKNGRNLVKKYPKK